MYINILILLLILILILIIANIIILCSNKLSYMGGMGNEDIEEKSTEYDLSTHSIPDDQIIINALLLLSYSDLCKLIKCKKEKTSANELDIKIIQLAEYIKEDTIKEYMKEWVDIYDIIAQTPSKEFISDMKNDECEKVEANDCFINKLPIGKKHCRYYQPKNGHSKCYSLSRFKRYNIFDAELSKIIKSRAYDTEYKIVYGYNNGSKYSGLNSKNSNHYWRYSLIISSKTNVRYILFHTGIAINIKMVEDAPKWQAAMNELIYLLLEDENNYTGMYIFCGHSMGCSLMLFLAYKLFTEYNAFFMSKCICFGSGQTTFFRKEMKDNIFFTSTNIYIFELIGQNDNYDENDKSSGPKWLIDPAILWPYYTITNLIDEDLEFIYIPFFITVIYTPQREYDRMLTRGEKQSYIRQDMPIAEIGVNHNYETFHQWTSYKKAINTYIKLLDLDSAYYDLNVILKSSSENELTDDRMWENRLCSTFLEKIHLYDWNWNNPNMDVICSYTYQTIQDMSKINTSNPMEAIGRYKEVYIKVLKNLKRSTTKENKFCALYGAPIMFRKKAAEPHAYIIYKDKDSDDLYVYNGRAKSIIIGDIDLANEHIAYSWEVENIKISPINIAIQSYADGLVCDNDENITRSKNYKGLCYPVAIVCAYLFMKYDNYKFADVINYLSTKSPDELSSLFLKMNNHLADTIEEYWF
uniref:Uncharacterized protein n=1 Tax=viral metagenome TaxID=1070528 RepID=A0A6C0HZV4_9ZZZZ